MNDMIMDMLIFKYYYVFLIEETIRKSWQEFYQNLSNLRQFNMRSSTQLEFAGLLLINFMWQRLISIHFE